MLGDFLEWAAGRKIQVIGGLPTTFDDEAIPNALIGRLCTFYQRHGHGILVLENKSQYPRSSFYDTSYHLVEEQQINHSRLVAGRLGEITCCSPNAELYQQVNDVCTAGTVR